jgi:DNA-binding NtrC family response regulator
VSYALLIDDDEQIIESARDLVQDQGLVLETATSWAEGLSKFHAYSPDLVISDFNLPGSDMGLNLLLKLARVRPSVKLILISAYLNEEDASNIEALGLIDQVVRKTTPIETARKILAAVSEAAAHSHDHTNWVDFANASSRVHDVDDEAFAKLDDYLRSHRLPSGSAGE